jgi:hypothetical protein
MIALGILSLISYNQSINREENIISSSSVIENYKRQINNKFKYRVASEPKTYEFDSQKEFDREINFPLEKPKYVIVKSHELWKFDKKLSQGGMDEIIEILNDSTNYKWGEIGTPYFDKYLVFFNSKNECVGLTELSYEGQTYSTPSVHKMKWGLNTKIKELISIIEK